MPDGLSDTSESTGRDLIPGENSVVTAEINAFKQIVSQNEESKIA